ncbi:unnamed protein product [Mytilus coruscus]|uniref:Integrase zinc-binding domain-containing protein n=1 Tax=Mytilus coruscus TaxID=42192 RepID=A0A6J8BHK9_MYTCO|nr:unnamed protein product [Mytilus coruscus]
MIADTIGLHQIINIDQFSSYQKLLRVSAYVLRFIQNCRKDKHSGMLTVSDIQNMSIMLIRNSQHRNYAEIMKDLKEKQTKNSLVKQLKLYLDHENIIRCGGGRINNANTLESAKFPVLLPSKDKLTDLIIKDAHTRNFHCGLESTVTVLRQHYWIPTIRRNSSYVTEKLNSYGTTWRFIPKRAPWFGGWWERLIGLTKNCIKKVLGRALVDNETLNTIITEVESILNDRPLTYVSSDPTDDEPLTPSHLLYGRRIRTLPYNGLEDCSLQPGTKDTTHESVTRQSKFLSLILKNFIKRWKQEYLTSLR